MTDQLEVLKQIIQATMNSKHTRWTIASREMTLNNMWKLVKDYERKLVKENG